MDSRRLDGRVALVTGAGNGIGRAIAREFASDGAIVAVTDIDLDFARESAEEVEGSFPLRLDVTSMESASSAVTTIEHELGPIDILANNAGVSTMAPVWELTERDWDFNFDLNAKGVFIVTQAVLTGMLERHRGSIVNIASMAGKKGVPRWRTMRPRMAALVSRNLAQSSWARLAFASIAFARVMWRHRCRTGSGFGNQAPARYRSRL